MKWLLTLPFFKEELRQIKIQAFRDAQKDILETMADDLDKKAKELADKKLSEMMSPIEWGHVVTFNERQGAVFIGGARAEHNVLQSLKAEAELLTSSELWKLLYETPNALAQQIMFKTGEDADAFKKGRAMIFHLDSQKKILDILKSYAPPKKVDIPK